MAEYFGTFSKGPEGHFESGTNRPVFKIASTFWFDDPNDVEWTVPAGSEVDGASIPVAFWSLIGGPFEGDYLFASVIHDYYCQIQSKTTHDTHRNFYYGMRAKEVPVWKAKAMYWAVVAFGPSWTIEKRVGLTQACDGESCVLTLAIMPEAVAASDPDIDFGDPTTLAVSLSRLTAIAKTLKTSDGEYFDVTPDGAREAELERMSYDALTFRSALASKNYDDFDLATGMLAAPSLSNLDDLEEWPGGDIPTPFMIRSEPLDLDRDAFLLKEVSSEELVGRLENLKGVYDLPQ